MKTVYYAGLTALLLGVFWLQQASIRVGPDAKPVKTVPVRMPEFVK